MPTADVNAAPFASHIKKDVRLEKYTVISDVYLSLYLCKILIGRNFKRKLKMFCLVNSKKIKINKQKPPLGVFITTLQYL